MPDSSPPPLRSAHPRRVLLVGATGTIGRATVRALRQRGHEVVCFVRSRPGPRSSSSPDPLTPLDGVSVRFGDLSDPASISRDGIRGESFDAVVSCLASRTGAPKDAWAVDYQATLNVMRAAQVAGATQMVLLSAICVQKPLLAFQQAKLALERELMQSGLTYSIVRATAFFKSLSGQIERLRQGKPFLVFGSGELTACKPISDDDLGDYLADCLDDASRHNRVLPIGGPGEALTPIEQGALLFRLLDRTPTYTHVPVAMLDVIITVLRTLGVFIPPLKQKAELARIGRYYATESMLVWDAATGRYDADATPSAGTHTLFEHYARLVRGEIPDDRGDHAVF